MTGLYDAYGRPIERGLLTRELAAPTLAGVRSIWTDQVASGLTPQRLASLLQAAAEGDHYRYLTLAEEMEERNLHYAAELAKRKLAVSRLPLTVEASSDTPSDQKLADAVRDMVRRPGIRSLIKNLLDGIAKGYSAVEILWDRSGPQWMPSFEWRDPRYFQWDLASRSELRLRDEADVANGLPLAPYKFIVHRPVIKSGLTIRGGLARLAAWAFMCSGYTIKDWLAFAEVFGMPLRLGKYGTGTDPKEIEILKMAVANLGTDAAAVFPESMKIELVEAAKSSGANEFFKVLAEYLDNRISEAVLGQTASSGGTPGKLGEEKLQAEVRDDIRDDDAEQVEETLNRDLVRPFIDLNYGPQENYPQACLRAVEQEDVKTLSEALAKLVPLGLEVEQSVVRDKLGLPDPEPGAKLLTAPMTIQTPQEATNRERRGCPHCGTALNRDAGDDADSDDIDAIVDRQLDGWEPVMESLLAPIRDLLDDLVRAGGSLEDFRDRIAELYPELQADLLTDDLAAATLRARAMGDAGDEV